MLQNHAMRGYLLATIGALLVGLFPLLFRELVLEVDSVALASFLLLVSAWAMSLPFACVDVAKNSIRALHKKERIRFIVLLAIMVLSGTSGNIFAAWALEEIMPATMQFLQRVEVIAVIILGALLLKETLTVRLFIATACALLGVFFIYRTDFSYPHWYSLLLPIISGVLFAVLNIAFKKASAYYSPMTLNAIRLFFTSMFLAYLSWEAMVTMWHNGSLTWQVLLLALLSAAVGPMGARTLYTYSFRYIAVGHSVLFTTLSPVATLFMQWLVLDSVPNIYELIGGIIIMLAIVYLIMPQIRKTTTVSDGA